MQKNFNNQPHTHTSINLHPFYFTDDDDNIKLIIIDELMFD